MKFTSFTIIILIINLAILLAIGGVLIYLVYLLIKALRKYIKSEPVRKEKAQSAKSLGEVLKRHRTECRMTQEFVAESIGADRLSPNGRAGSLIQVRPILWHWQNCFR